MKVKLQRGAVKDGEFYVTSEEIEVDDGWFIRNAQAFIPPNSTIYVGQHVYDAFKKELAKLSRDPPTGDQ